MMFSRIIFLWGFPIVLNGEKLMNNHRRYHTHPGRFASRFLSLNHWYSMVVEFLGTRLGTWAAATFLFFGCIDFSSAQVHDSFEGGQPRWRLVESDCRAQLALHEISLVTPHGGRTSELMDIACTEGAAALLAYPVEPSVVLDEFQPRIWVRCSSSRIRLGARVVFPLGTHPVTQGRMTTILWGDTYTESGRWQVLRLESLQGKLEQEVTVLRARYGAQINFEGAYIDSLVLNAYTGPGRYRLQLDDLSLTGMLPLTATGTILPADWKQRWRWRFAVASPEQRFWAQVNEAPIWLQYRGESLPWVRSLGIHGLFLNQLPTVDQLEKIHAARLVALSPPPENSVVFDGASASAIKGWIVGSALDGRQAVAAREQAERIAQLGKDLARPLVGEVLERHWQFMRIADEVIIPVPMRAAAGGWAEKQQWLSRKLSTVRQRSQGWVTIEIDNPPSIEEQYRAANAAISVDRAPQAMMVDPVGMRHRAVSAVIAGARGILYRTSQPLDEHSANGRVKVAAMRWLNRDLQLWGPWLVGGHSASKPQLSRRDYDSAAWDVSDSYLIIAQTSAEGSQYCLPATMNEPLRVTMQLPSAAMQVLRLTESRLESVQVTRTGTEFSWATERPSPQEVYVATSNPLVLDFVRKQTHSAASSNAADQLEIVSHNLTVASSLVDQRFSQQMPEAQRLEAASPQLRMLALATRQLEQGWQALRAQQPNAAISLGLAASDAIQSVLFDASQTAVSNLSSPQSSPFVVSPTTLHMHWKLADACSRSSWRSITLPGGQFTDLQHMLDVGWTQRRRLEDEVDLRVELVPKPSGVGAALRLAAYQKTEQAKAEMEGGYEGASLRVRSAGATVQRGQLVRISATAHVLSGNTAPQSGLLVYDNQAGPSLGQLVQGETGEEIPIEMYRFMVADDEFRLLAECRGECDILLNDIQFSVIKPASERRSFVTSPAIEFPEQELSIGGPETNE